MSAYGCDVPFILLYLLRHIVIFNIGSSPRPRARTKPIYARQGEIRERRGGGWRLGDCQQQISMILRLLEPDTADCAYHGAEDILMESEGIRCPHLLPIESLAAHVLLFPCLKFPFPAENWCFYSFSVECSYIGIVTPGKVITE